MSRYTWQLHAAVIPASMLILFSAGCAKEPATSMALAPSPGGAAGTSASSSDEGGGQGGGVVGRGGGGVVGAGGGAQGVGGAGAEDGSGRMGDGGRSDFAAGGGGAAGSTLARGGASAGQSGSQSMVAAARPQPKEFSGVTGLQDIHFDFDKYALRPEDAQLLSANAEWLREHPRAVILIEGHCDDRGTNEYNLALGNHRAESALKYLIAQGVARSRMSTLSYGEERPLCTEETEECWARNRRAHFLVKRQ